jgi:hypothetical protein
MALPRCFSAAIIACGGGGGDSAPTTPNPTVLTTLSVSLAPATIQVGQTATAAGRDQFGASIATGTVTWVSSSPQVATVTASGAVLGVAAGQVFCAAPGTSEVVLTPIERAAGTKIAVIPTGPNAAVVVESGRAEGYDTNGSLTPGVLVYLIDTAIPSGSGPLKVLPINDADANKNTAALLPGGSVTLGSVTVTFLSQDANGDGVRVVR